MKLHHLLLVALLLPTGAAFGAHSDRQYIHPKLTDKERVIKAVLVLPPQVNINRSGMKGKEGMLKESEEVSQKLVEQVAKMLREYGFEVPEPAALDKALADNQELKYSLATLQKRYDAVSPQLVKKPKDVRKARFTLGDEVASFNPGGPSDTLAFIRASGTQLTKGKAAFGILVTGPARSTLTSEVSLVDAKTGDVLFMAKIGIIGDFTKNPEKAFGKPLADSFKKIPK